jgi:hypothetical protein
LDCLCFSYDFTLQSLADAFFQGGQGHLGLLPTHYSSALGALLECGGERDKLAASGKLLNEVLGNKTSIENEITVSHTAIKQAPKLASDEALVIRWAEREQHWKLGDVEAPEKRIIAGLYGMADLSPDLAVAPVLTLAHSPATVIDESKRSSSPTR